MRQTDRWTDGRMDEMANKGEGALMVVRKEHKGCEFQSEIRKSRFLALVGRLPQ